MVLEVAILNILPGRSEEFETAFREAQKIISAVPGYIKHEVQKCIENPDQYILMINWETLEDHTVGFRGSEAYQQWKALLHHLYEPFPTVEHYTRVF
jgi:heme-degrading monooxygenase HmoA